MAQLREYRALQGELEPWTVAFAAENDRKATIRDVEAAGQSCLAGVVTAARAVLHDWQ